MVNRRFGLVLILIAALTLGCSRAKAAPATHDLPNFEPAKVQLPDLVGGAESQNRRAGAGDTDLSKQFPNVFYYSGPRQGKKVALTFDDGPDTNFTGQILDILKKNNVKATFFVVGIRAQAYPGMIRRISAEGHAIGNHTWDHHSIANLGPDEINAEILQTDQLLFSILGTHPNLFRPPYGAIAADTVPSVSAMGYKIIGWSVDTRDWAGTLPQQILKNVQKEVYPGGIILQHSAGGSRENLGNTVKALPQIIAALKSQGYTFVTVPELLNIH